MALSPAQYVLLIVSELNGTADQINALRERGEVPRFLAEDISGAVETAWQMHSERGIDSVYLQYLYAKRQSLIWLQGQVWDEVTWQDADANEAANQAFQDLVAMIEPLTAEIRLYEQRRASAGVVSGEMAAVTPTPREPNRPDPYDRRYRGDPRRAFPPYWP